ncbi:SDR family NAD(P)-dependent oxidoreductase [Aquimarina mytili]|uniref:SDR family NAD(P)-dependent oxidoreductase n=1 Tax=Aquimarina mytili TaxID=874423 RepID=A0A936ZNN6_9FLAO|nr:SDR family NAD(P)-dependent oxidoreductase [Aquimarina mytili]MBL0682949.1 SDR family NAD(P)-dependent oxidoreductase [Aquimarina mytili]
MKTIVITGSTDGIGKLTAIKLANNGHNVYIHGRSPEKLANVILEIKQTSNNPNIEGFAADFSNLEDVKSMADEIKAKLSKIDVLINNAGVFKSSNGHTKYGDIRMVVNYLAPYLLTKSLMPLLELGKESRIINLSSAAQSPVSLEAVGGVQISNVNSAYAQSKLALTMWSFYLANQQNKVALIAVNPGSLLNTRMVAEAYGQHWSPATKGSDILFDLAVSAAYNGITGKYFNNDKGSPKGTFGPAHQDAYDEDKITVLINKTEEIIN